MAESETEIQESGLQTIGVFPMIVGILGGGALLGGLAVLGIAIYTPSMRDKIDTVRDVAVIPAIFIAGGLLMLGIFFLLKEMRLLEKKVATIAEHSFDREVAALLAALRPFAERLEERIGPVLTASQKLQKPLDAVHADLQQQGQKIQDLTNGFDEMKMLLNRTRDDLTSLGRGKSVEPLQKLLEEVASAVKNAPSPKFDLQPVKAIEKQIQDLTAEFRRLAERKIEFPKIEMPSLDPLQRSLEDSLGSIRDRQESLAQMLAQMPAPAAPEADASAQTAASHAAIENIQAEIAASKALVERCLSAAQTAAEAAQRAASAAEQASNRADRVEQTLRSMPAPAAPTATEAPAPAPSPSVAPAAPSAESTADPAAAAAKPSSTPASSTPQETRSIKDAIAKLKMFRGGPA